MAKEKAIWFPLYVPDYLADTQSLTTEQHGAYLLLLMAYWQAQGPLADDDEELAAICRMPLDGFLKAKKRLSRFFTVADGVWHHKRVDAELAKATGLIARKSAAGKASAQQRANRQGNRTSTEAATEQATAGQLQANQSQPQSQSDNIKDSKESLPSKTDDWPDMPEFMRADLRPRFDTVRGGAKRFAGLGERPFKPKDQQRADKDMERHLTSMCGLDLWRAQALIIAARDPDNPDHIDAARTCERESRKHRLGWFHAEAAE